MTISTATTAELAGRMRLVVTRMGRRLRRHAGGDLTPSQASALSTLEHHGPMTFGELSAHENVRPPTMTKIVAALEEQGLVRRRTDPADRRVSHVEATREGSALLARERDRSSAYLAARLEALPPEDLAALGRAVDVLERLMEEDG